MPEGTMPEGTMPEAGAAPDRRANVAALLALAAAAAAIMAVSFITIDRLKDAVIDASLHGRPIRAGLLLSAPGVAGFTMLALAALALLLLVWLEVARASFSRLLRTASGAEAFILLLILVVLFGHAYLNPGVLLGGDTGSHIARILEVRRGLQNGTLPFWTNYQYAGAPLLWFTGPLLYVVGGGIDYAVHDALLTAKWLLFALHVLSGLLFYAWMRRLSVGPVAAALAAAMFAGSFAHLHLLLFRGVLPQAFTIVFLVLVFFAADGLCRGRGWRWVNLLIFALATAGLIVNHQPHALFVAAYLVLFSAVSLVVGFWYRRGVPWLMAAGLAGVVTSMIAVLPVMAEADWVMIEPAGAPFRLRIPSLSRLLHLVLWRNTRTTWGADVWAYLGLGLVLFGLAGLVGLLLRRLRSERRAVALPAMVCLLASFFLWNPLVRDIVFLLFFLAILAAIGLDWLIDNGLLAGRALLAAVVLVVIDLASTAIQPVARTDKDFLIEAGRYLERTAPDQRVVALIVAPDGRLEANIDPHGTPMSYDALVQRVVGNHNLAATRLHNLLVTVAELAARDLRQTGRLSAEAEAGLGLFNVRRVICYGATALGCPDTIVGGVDDPVLGRYLPVPGAPVLFSRLLVSLEPDRGLEKPVLWGDDFQASRLDPRIPSIRATLQALLRIEQPDFAAGRAVALAVRGPAGALPAARQPWHATLTAYAVTLDRVSLTIDSDAPGFVQLAHPWFPSTRVSLDGQAVLPWQGSAGLMVLPLPAGHSTIILRDGWTPVRRLAAWLSAAGVLLTIGIAVAGAWPGSRGTGLG